MMFKVLKRFVPMHWVLRWDSQLRGNNAKLRLPKGFADERWGWKAPDPKASKLVTELG